MSRVFVADEIALSRKVVIKVLPLETAAHLSLERFKREIALAARLQHPHIVPLLSAGETGGLPYFTMPFVAGETLRVRLASGGELPVGDAIRILREIASALACAHEAGIVHRDIKPENILLSGGSAMVTDFGVAKAMDAAAADEHSIELTGVGITLGTPSYMSPEQAAASPTIDARSDIYSFGVMAYEIFGGRTPFAGRSVQATLAAHMIEVPEPLGKLRASVPPPVASLVMRCLEKRPADRPQTAAELITTLDASAGSSGEMGATHSANRKLYRTVGAGVLVAAVVAIVFVIASRRPAPTVVAERSVAVMPLTNGDSATEYLSSGIADEVRSELTTQGQGVRVMSGSSSNAFRGKPIDAVDVGKRLHVSYAVLGEMRRSHGAVHVTAELVNTADGIAMWNGAFDRKETDVSSLADSITRAIVRALKVSPNGAVARTNAGAGTSNPAAYDLYLRARYLADKRGAAELALAAQLAQQAINLDPKFARAYAELGIATGLSGAYSNAETGVLAARAVRAEKRAIELDSTLADAWAALGFWSQPTLRWDESERSLRHALTLDPGYTLGHKWLGQVLATLGRTDEAVEECRIATQLDPLLATTWDTYAKVLLMTGKDSAAFDAASRALELNPAMKSPHWWRALVDLNRGQKQAALDEVARDTTSAYPGDVGMWGYIRAMAGQRDAAIAAAKRLDARATKGAPEVAGAAVIYLGLGDYDRALADFIVASVSGSADFSIMMGGVGSPVLDPLRTKPRFAELLRTMNLQDQPVARLKR